MKIFPAIDLIGGQAVRLTKGDYDQVKIYDPDPVKRALFFAKEGAKNLHLVDLDGARTGEMPNASLIAKICKESGMFVEVGGGIRSKERIEGYLNAGVGRCILGTAAIEDPVFAEEMIRQYGDRVTIGIDTKGGKIATRGWMEDSGLDGIEFCERMQKAGLSSVIWTDIEKDGMLSGCNMSLYEELCSRLSLQIIASGGVTGKEEILALKKAGCGGAILGKALYEGVITLKEALAAGGED